VGNVMVMPSTWIALDLYYNDNASDAKSTGCKDKAPTRRAMRYVAVMTPTQRTPDGYEISMPSMQTENAEWVR
jgi:hypothetical protein